MQEPTYQPLIYTYYYYSYMTQDLKLPGWERPSFDLYKAINYWKNSFNSTFSPQVSSAPSTLLSLPSVVLPIHPSEVLHSHPSVVLLNTTLPTNTDLLQAALPNPIISSSIPTVEATSSPPPTANTWPPSHHPTLSNPLMSRPDTITKNAEPNYSVVIMKPCWLCSILCM